MRDLIKIAAAGTVMAAYALLAPSLVEAVPGATGSAKAFTQRLQQASGTVQVSARIDGEAPIPGQVVVTRRPLLVGISTGETSR